MFEPIVIAVKLRHVSSFYSSFKNLPPSGGLWTFKIKSKNISVLFLKLSLVIKRANTFKLNMSIEI